jgi:hypothetical protein
MVIIPVREVTETVALGAATTAVERASVVAGLVDMAREGRGGGWDRALIPSESMYFVVNCP